VVSIGIDGPVGVRLLGSIEVGRADDPIAVAGTRLQALVAALALSVPHQVTDDSLIDAIWGDQVPANPANALQAQVSQLRRLLGASAVSRRGSGYALMVEPDDVDALRLERLVRDGREEAGRGDPWAAAATFTAGLSLVRGAPLAELTEMRFAREAATRLTEVVLAAHEGLVDAQLATGRHAEAVSPLTELVRSHPLRERFHAQLILALYRCGRQSEALRAYQDVRAVLAEELGIDPGVELKELERAVLAHDPALAAPPAPSRSRPGPLDGSGAPSPSGPADGVTGFPLIGRDSERHVLRGDLAEVLAGRGRIALLGGEPGIGKTRLAEELTADALGRGATVVWGRCYDGRGAPAFWPWTQIVHGLLGLYADHDLIGALGGGIADVAQIAPEVKELVDQLEPLPPLDPESARFRLGQAVSRFVRRLAAVRPLTIALDDLQWADESSLGLLTFLAMEIAESPLFVVATYRDLDPTLSGPLSQTLAELSRRPLSRRVDLAGLDRDGIALFLAAAGAEASDELLATMHRRTEGNPFFVTEVLRLLPPTAVTDESSLGRVVPASAKAVIRRRLTQLPETTTGALTAASVLGQDFDLAVLSALVGVDGATLLDQLDPAVAAGILVESPEGIGRSRFSHGLVNETIYHDMSAAQRARTHRRAAEAIAAHHGDADGPHLIALAAHWFHAVPAAPPDPGIDCALRAARWAQTHVAHRQAEELLRSALELLPGIPDGRVRAARELEVQDQLGNLLIVTSGYSTPGLDQVCARQRELCQAIDDRRLLVPALWRLSIFYLVSTELDTAVTLGEQLLALAGDDDPGTLLAGHMALGVIRTHRGEIVVARRHFDAAMELGGAGHDRAVADFVAETPAVWIRVFGAWNWWLLDQDDRARQNIDEALTVAAAGGVHTYAMTFAVWFASLLATLRRDADEGRRRSEEGLALAMAGGYGMCLPFLTAQLGWALAAQGDFEGGSARLLAGDAALRASGAGIMRHVFPGFHADACLVAGRPAEARAWTERGLAEVEITGERWFEAELHRLRGEALAGVDPADPVAVDEFRRAVEIATAQGAEVLRRRAEESLTRSVDAAG
jgi:DNA-binding SARP family transcriptional activator